MHLEGRFGVSQTNQLVGVADDAFENDIIANELKVLDENDGQTEEEPVRLQTLAKHFLVMIATTWAPDRKIQFLVGHWSLKTITAAWLARTLLSVIATIAFYGFIVDQLGTNGAGENRFAFKTLYTISTKELLETKYLPEDLKGLSLDFKIAFPYPVPVLTKKGIIIMR